MKKFIVIILFTFFVSSVFAQNGIIMELSGNVELKHSGSLEFVKAEEGENVALNTIISTGFRSTAVISVGSSIITVRPLTRLSLAEIQSSENAENVNVNLQAGRVRVDVNPPAGTRANMTIKSPTATASVRGTSFEFDTVNLTVNKGSVLFNGNAGPAAMVNAGEQTFVGTDGTAVNPGEVISAALAPPVPVGTPDNALQSSRINSGDFTIRIEYQ